MYKQLAGNRSMSWTLPKNSHVLRDLFVSTSANVCSAVFFLPTSDVPTFVIGKKMQKDNSISG